MTLPKNFLLVNKPVGWTSFDAVGFIRTGLKKLDPKYKNIKVGHAGTLDPFADGLLIIGVGREATRQIDSFKSQKKTYRATIKLGATSDTQDLTGKISELPPPTTLPDEKTVQNILQKFIGLQEQTPPMFSAKKIDGVRLYKLARQGKEIERQPNQIEIYDLKLLAYAWPELTIEVTCSAGTYIRTLAYDIGDKLGVGAYCQTLQRTAIGEYMLADATTPDQALTELKKIFTIQP